MAKEIERKYLLESVDSLDLGKGEKIIQGYIPKGNTTLTTRVRVYGNHAYLCIKTKTKDGTLIRDEFEYEIPVDDAEQLLQFCKHKIEKTRYLVKKEGYVWEVDLFEKENEGLILAEVELASEDEYPPEIDGILAEVSSDYRFLNVFLVEHPWKTWGNNPDTDIFDDRDLRENT